MGCFFSKENSTTELPKISGYRNSKEYSSDFSSRACDIELKHKISQ